MPNNSNELSNVDILFVTILFSVYTQCYLHVRLTTHSARMEGHALMWVQVTPSVFVLLHILGCTVRKEGVLVLALSNWTGAVKVSTEHHYMCAIICM